MRTLVHALQDLRRTPCWNHENQEPKSRIWFYKFPFHWGRPWRWTNWLPWIGGDEWCRWTLVIVIPFLVEIVIPLWECRDPACEGCEYDCTKKEGM